MKIVIYAAILLAVCLARASALKCYTCENCILSGILAVGENSDTCGAFLQTECIKTVSSTGTVSRSCTDLATCTLLEIASKCRSGSDKGCSICCNTDNCNGAAATKASFMGLALAFATAVFSKYL